LLLELQQCCLRSLVVLRGRAAVQIDCLFEISLVLDAFFENLREPEQRFWIAAFPSAQQPFQRFGTPRIADGEISEELGERELRPSSAAVGDGSSIPLIGGGRILSNAEPETEAPAEADLRVAIVERGARAEITYGGLRALRNALVLQHEIAEGHHRLPVLACSGEPVPSHRLLDRFRDAGPVAIELADAPLAPVIARFRSLQPKREQALQIFGRSSARKTDRGQLIQRGRVTALRERLVPLGRGLQILLDTQAFRERIGPCELRGFVAFLGGA